MEITEKVFKDKNLEDRCFFLDLESGLWKNGELENFVNGIKSNIGTCL